MRSARAASRSVQGALSVSCLQSFVGLVAFFLQLTVCVVPSQFCAAESTVEPLVFMYPVTAKSNIANMRKWLHPQHRIEFFDSDKLLRCSYVAALSWTFLVRH